MNTSQMLNQFVLSQTGDNTRRKSMPLVSTATVATGTLEYQLFQNTVDYFNNNKKLPLSGSQMFFNTGIEMSVNMGFPSGALTLTQLSQLLFQSYIEIYVSEKQQAKFPLYECMNIDYGLNLATNQIVRSNYFKPKKRLVFPIFLNSTQNVTYIIYLYTGLDSVLNGKNIRVVLDGYLLDKLSDFNYDNVVDKQFQKVSNTIYEVGTISSANATQYTLFADNTVGKYNFSNILPPSEYDQFQLEAMEFVFIIADTIENIYNDKKQNYLTVKINDTEFYNASIENAITMFAGPSGTITNSAADTIAYTDLCIQRNQNILKFPIQFPSKANTLVTLNQPASSLGNATNFLAMFKGTRTRRVN